ncbi:hypothetical protein [Novosphingobium sp. 9]|uniref:hypothetical protein n=1 Tax=Novosphingobium sp. 9 TaxID=2025349 RepID=UPI0021B68CC6|nr:hypothetical protein [Novosphingobium sp. 9]
MSHPMRYGALAQDQTFGRARHIASSKSEVESSIGDINANSGRQPGQIEGQSAGQQFHPPPVLRAMRDTRDDLTNRLIVKKAFQRIGIRALTC